MLTQLTLREMLSNLDQISREVLKMKELVESEIAYTKEEFDHAMKRGDRIKAIRIYQRQHECSLLKAKDEVEALMIARDYA